jgi:hypothetical protein
VHGTTFGAPGFGDGGMVSVYPPCTQSFSGSELKPVIPYSGNAMMSACFAAAAATKAT